MPKTLLLADDSVTIQKVVGITFANEDIRLVTENNGDAALARAREIEPAIVLADVSMPGLNGYELCAAIKADPRLAKIPVILLTGTFESYDEHRTEEVGADGHIAKPFEAQMLVDLVHATLERPASAAPATPEPSPTSSVTETSPPAQPEPAAEFNPEFSPTAEPAPAEVLAPEPQEQAASETDFAFADFSPSDPAPALETAQEPPAPLAGDMTEFYDGAAASATASAPPVPTPPAAPEPPSAAPDVDASQYEETSFLDPRAALSSDASAPAAVTPRGQTGAGATSVPEISPPEASSPGFDPGAAPDLEALDVGAPDLRTPAEDRASASGETTWRLSEDTPSQPAQPDATAPAAERALDDVSSPDVGLRVVHASPDETFSNLDWAEPLDEGGETDPVPPPGEGLSKPAQGPTAAPEPRAPAASPPFEIDSAHLHESLEKVAWEAFGPLSEQLVGEAVRKIEEIAWEVIPQLAERLIREEIAKLKGES